MGEPDLNMTCKEYRLCPPTSRCIKGPHGFKCVCESGYVGALCEKKEMAHWIIYTIMAPVLVLVLLVAVNCACWCYRCRERKREKPKPMHSFAYIDRLKRML